MNNKPTLDIAFFRCDYENTHVFRGKNHSHIFIYGSSVEASSWTAVFGSLCDSFLVCIRSYRKSAVLQRFYRPFENEPTLKNRWVQIRGIIKLYHCHCDYARKSSEIIKISEDFIYFSPFFCLEVWILKASENIFPYDFPMKAIRLLTYASSTDIIYT